MASEVDTAFVGSVPELYQRYLVPLIFEPYAVETARRALAYNPTRVLEIAAGTGVVTRHLAATLPLETAIVATDLNQAMLDRAMAEGAARLVEWRQADALALPFPDASFDLVICQFGAMFFPDRARAYAEAKRVLRPGGRYLLAIWDRIEENDFADTVTATLATIFPDDPPRFMARIPHGYHDPAAIAADLACGGFTTIPEMTTISARSRAESAKIPAIAYCQGSPLRGEIEARDASRLGEATDLVAVALDHAYGAADGSVDGKIQAHLIAIDA